MRKTPAQTMPRRVSLEVLSAPSEGAKALAVAIASAPLDKKAVNIQILDVVGRVDYADFLVLMSGRSDRHVLSIADGIEDSLVHATPKRKPSAVEGRQQASWIVLDYADVVVHVFQEESRAFYDLDALWQDARRVPVATSALNPFNSPN
ncbi:MAG: ribosome silencing factor [Polyangiales bacterium]